MTRDETKKIIMVISASYPNFKPQDLRMTVDTWQMMLDEYSYTQVSMAVKAYIASDTSGFAPSIGQVIGLMNKIEKPEELNEMEAWALVSRAIRNGYYGAEKEYEKLPTLVQKAVGTPGQLRNWSQTDTESIENVVQSNFMRTYRTVVKSSQEIARMPENIRNLIEQTGQKMLGAKEIHTLETMVEDKSEPLKESIPMPETVMQRFRKIMDETGE